MLPSPTLDEVLCEDGEVALYRAHTDDGRRLLMRVVKAGRATSAEYESLRHESELARLAGAEVAAEPEYVTTIGGHPTLVLRDDGGAPLSRRLVAPLAVERFFPLALEIVTAMAKIHARHVVHGALHPANILELRDGRVELIGFARLEQRGSLSPPRPSLASRPYLSPEQTARLSRRVDERSDLYALGIVFFEMLTGGRPFHATDPVGWVYAHCALPPPPIATDGTSVPPSLAAIVEKLLSKLPEARYQSAEGLRDDLERAFADWKAGRREERFPLGRSDPPPPLRVSGQTHGRQNELQRIRLALSRASRQRPVEIVLVSGPAGVGKRSVVRDALRELPSTPYPPLRATGRCRLRRAGPPGAALLEALDGLLAASLELSHECPANVAEELVRSLGVNLPLLAALLPRLGALVESPRPPTDVPLPESSERLFGALARFIGTFSSEAHPAVLVLEDLQWADDVTLDVLARWAMDPRSPPLLVLGTYRSDEVSSAHPLCTSLSRMREGHAALDEIFLGPLPTDSVADWLAELLRTSREQVAPFAARVSAHTGGNPFFIGRLVEWLHARGCIRWDAEERRWCWSLEDLSSSRLPESTAALSRRASNRCLERRSPRSDDLRPTATRSRRRCSGRCSEPPRRRGSPSSSPRSERRSSSDPTAPSASCTRPWPARRTSASATLARRCISRSDER